MAELRNMFDWKPVSKGLQLTDGSWHWLSPVDSLVVDHTDGQVAAWRYLDDKAHEVIIPSVWLPIAIVLMIIGALGLIAWNLP